MGWLFVHLFSKHLYVDTYRKQMSFLNKFKYFLVALAMMAGVQIVNAQRVSLKTNGLYWLATSPNLGAELRMSRHFTLNLEAAGNPFTIGGHKMRHASVFPELRYWFAGRPQVQHFAGVMALASVFDMEFKGNMHQGVAGGLGLTYGYSFVLSKRLSLETTVGLGAVYYKERKYPVNTIKPNSFNHNGIALTPTKIGVSIVYILK